MCEHMVQAVQALAVPIGRVVMVCVVVWRAGV